MRERAARVPRESSAPRPARGRAASGPARSRRRRPPAQFSQGEARRYRFVYAKLGPSAFLSHLDVIRALPRAFRRLDLPLFYSQGFHPKPDMTFGPALSLGVSSLAEVVDLKVTCDFEPEEILARLTEGAHGGMRFRGGTRLGPDDPGISKIIDGARYVVGFARSAVDEGWIAERIARSVEASELVALRRIDGVGKKVDVKRFLRGIARSERAQEALVDAGLLGDLVGVEVDLGITSQGAAKISEVVAVVFGDVPFRAVRAEMGAWKDGRLASPLELELLKKAPSPVVVADAASVVEELQ